MKNTFTDLLLLKRPPFTRRNIEALIMRISQVYILLITSTIIAVASPKGNGQSIETTTVELEIINEPLKNVFQKIEAQTDFLFHWNDNVNNYTSVMLPKGSYTVKDALDIVLQGTELKYVQSQKYVLVTAVREKEAVRESTPDKEAAQSERRSSAALVTGTVKDATTQEPIAGVNIIVKGTTKGTTTDVEGRFGIEVEANDVLVFSFIGFKSFEAAVGGRSTIDVAMESDVTALQEVEVNAGYWTVTEKERTGNISRVTAEEIERQPVSNVMQALQGRMPGVEITQQSGVPGSNFTIRIRGQNSVRSDGNEPLYLIDGVPFPSNSIGDNVGGANILPGGVNPLSAINPSDIESIEVLKDADATAIYGSRGANGIILITTKKAKTEKAKLDLNIQTGFSEVTNKRVNLLSTEQYIEMRLEAFDNDGRTPGPSDYDVNGDWDQTRYTDWQEVLLGGQAQTTNLRASISAGNDNVSFLFSGNYYKESTFFPGNFSAQRGSGHLNLGYSNNDQRFKMNISTTHSLGLHTLPTQNLAQSARTLPPNAPSLYDEDGNLNWELNSNGSPTWENPFSFLNQKFEVKTSSLITNIGLSYQFLSSLQIKTTLGYSILMDNSTTLHPIRSKTPSPTSTHLTRFYNSQAETFNFEPQIVYHQSVLGGELNAVGGITIQEGINSSQGIVASGFVTEALMENIGAAQSIDNRSSGYTQYRYNAVFGRINYDWGNKYIINLTGRRDGSSRFGSGRQFANLGAVGLAWIFSNESFSQKKLPFLSFGKLRTSYGVTGNDQIGDYGYLDSYRSADYPYQTPALTPTRMANPDYGWEINKKFEVALETGFVQNRLNFAASWYHNRSTNQLVGYPLPYITGFSGIQANLPATVQNTGCELELNTTNIQKEGFSWRTRINITLSRNKLIEYPDLELSSYANSYVVGEPLHVTRGYTFLGIDPDTGLERFLDIDENGSIDINDLEILYAPQPLYGGVDNTIQYNGLHLSVFFQFSRKGNRDYRNTFTVPGRIGNQPVEVMNRWQEPGDNTHIRKFTSGGSATSYNNWKASDNNFNNNTSFIRLKNISISWAIPMKWIKRIKVQRSSLYMHAQNLLIFTKYKGADPETGSGVPPLRTITTGLQIVF